MNSGPVAVRSPMAMVMTAISPALATNKALADRVSACDAAA